MWTWLLVALVMGLVVSPIVSLMPNKRQRTSARLRTYAARLGLRVRLVTLTAANARERGETLAVYSLPWLNDEDAKLGKQPPWWLVRVNYAHEIHAFQDWDWVNASLKGDNRWRQALQNLLRQAQGDPLYQRLVALEWTRHGVHVYWRETDNEADVDRLASLLGALKAFGQNSSRLPQWPVPADQAGAD